MRLRLPRLTGKQQERRGSVLLIVLVVIVLLSLGAYTFSEMMVVEIETAELHGRQVQARVFADSGLDYVVTLLDNESSVYPLDTYHDPALYRDIVVLAADNPRAQGRFSVVAPCECDDRRQTIRFGLINESGKLNINALSQHSSSTAREMLMAVPEMTDEIADSILDWTDKNDNPRDYGAEDDYYLSLATPYAAKNGPLESLDELLLVRGMTPWLLYGEDANRNGLLDPGEDDGDASHPPDNADGELELGFSAYLTVNSKESNLREDGTKKINIASDKLDELYDELETEYDKETAQFVIAYRLFGPAQSGSSRSSSRSRSSSGGSAKTGGGGQAAKTGEQGASYGETSDNIKTGESGASTGSSPGGATAQQAANAAGKAVFGGQGKVTRGGLDLTNGSRYPVRSIFDLIGVSVDAKIDSKEKTLTSPWSDETSEMQEYLPELDGVVTALAEDNLSGRINVNEAPLEILKGLPDIDDELASTIVSSRSIDLEGASLSEQRPGRETCGWLMTEGLTDLDTVRKIAPFLTTKGDVYRVQILGYYDAGPPLVRIEAAIDASQSPPRVLSVRDLTPLGIGYPRDLFATRQ